MADKIKLAFKVDRSVEAEVAKRADRRMRREAPTDLGDVGKSIQFLRGVSSRSSFALTSFYLFLATDGNGENACTVSGYPGKVLQSQLNFSSLNTIAMACRKVFDHGGKALHGAAFGRQDNVTLGKHAEHWVRYSRCREGDALKALHFLRTFFAACSKTDTRLFKDGTTLGRRIGFVKQYADGAAAHLTLQDYEFDRLDLAHVVAAMALVGQIIRSFDSPGHPGFYNEIDEAAFNAAVALFPDAPKIRLFDDVRVEQQARMCWEWGEQQGMNMLMEQLPYAISWF